MTLEEMVNIYNEVFSTVYVVIREERILGGFSKGMKEFSIKIFDAESKEYIYIKEQNSLDESELNIEEEIIKEIFKNLKNAI